MSAQYWNCACGHGNAVTLKSCGSCGKDKNAITMPLLSKAQGRQRRQREPNRTEREYGLMLGARKRAGEITEYAYERYSLILGDRCRYVPDYAVVLPDRTVEFHEVKGGFIFSRALVKPRAAATQFPQHKFFIAQKIDGRWSIDEIARR